MKKSLPIAAVFCAVFLLPAARGRAQDLYVGSNAANVTTNFTSGTNLFANVYVGYSSNVSTFSATNNLLIVSGSGTLLTNTNNFYLGFNGSGSRLVISNGGQVATAQYAYIGYTSFASNSSALITGTNSRWTALGFDIGYNFDNFPISGSSLVISNGGQALGTFGVRIGGYSSSNSVLVSGAGSLLSGPVNLGGDVGLGHFNSLVVSNGGTVTSTNPSVGGVIGRDSSNNTVLVTGSGSAWTESGTINLGYYGKGTGNRLVISNGGTLTSAGGTIGVGNTSVDPALSGNASNSVLVTGTNSSWTSTGLLVVGRNSDGNSLTIADGGSVICGTNLTINQLYRNTNGSYAGSLVLVQSGRLVVTNGQINFGAGLGTLQVDGGTVEVKQLLATTPITPAGQIFPAERRGSHVLLNSGTMISGATTISNESGKSDNRTFYIGGNTGSGASFVAKGGTHTFWANVAVGDSGSNNSLVVTNGAEVFLKSRPDAVHGPSGGTNFVIGVATGAANNSVSISSGRFVMTNGTFEIGRAGSGALNVTGGSVEVKTLLATNGTNSVIAFNGGTIASQSTTVSNGASFVIGNTGSGASFIANGGAHNFASGMVVGNSGSSNSLVVSNGGGVAISEGSIGFTTNSSSNSILVTGTGSLLTNSGALSVGYQGSSNSLVISNAGTVVNSLGYVGIFGFSSNNSVLVTGTNSLWNNGLALFIGGTNNSSSGNSMVVSNGGLVTVGIDSVIGSGSSSNNTALVTGAGSRWTSGGITVGAAGRNNSLTISDAGVASSANGNIGSATNSSGNSALVSGANSVWTNSQNLRVGYEGRGNSLVISNGGTVANVEGSIGYTGFSSNNNVLVTGANSVWTNSGYFYVGAYGSSNSLVVSNGGTVAALISQIGTFGSSLNNSVLVTGTNTLFNNALYLFIGGQGNSGNSMVISNGGLVTVGIDSRIGGDVAADNNSVLVTGAGSRWSNAFSLFVGSAGVSNSLVITNGGEVFVGTNLSISAQAGASNNSVTVGGGRLVVSNGEINIGAAGSGALHVNGGTVEAPALIATNGANSALNFNGGTIISRGTTVSNATDFYVGDTGSGATFIANGGGHSFASNMVVGNTGSGNSLIISNGATVTNFRAWLGYNAGSSNNSALVTGTNSLWTNRSTLRLGSSGSGNSLVISNGGVAAYAVGFVGFFDFSSNNAVHVTGAGSVWTNFGETFVGYRGSGNSLIVSNGGTVANTRGIIGGEAVSANNSALVTGAGSLWTNSGGIFIGDFSSGSNNTLTVANGGTVAATNIVLGSQAGSSGTLNIGRFGTNDTAGTINAPTIAFGSGSGEINFNQSDSTTISATLSGNGSVNQLGTGTTILSGGSANTYSGTTTVSGGTLNLNKTAGVDAIAGAVAVSSGATLLLSSGENVNDSTAVTLSGGTITRGSGVSETFGNLNLTQASFLDFGNGASGNLTFGTYTPSSLLTVNNFLPGNTLVFGSDLRSTITNSTYFTFANGGIGSSSWNESTSTFTITAIPEPSTCLAAIGLLALMLWPFRRKRSA